MRSHRAIVFTLMGMLLFYGIRLPEILSEKGKGEACSLPDPVFLKGGLHTCLRWFTKRMELLFSGKDFLKLCEG